MINLLGWGGDLNSPLLWTNGNMRHSLPRMLKQWITKAMLHPHALFLKLNQGVPSDEAERAWLR
jgi:hypothetical protein